MPAISRFFALLLFASFLIVTEPRAQAEYAVAPAPAWVNLLDADHDASPSGSEAGGIYYLVIDDQVRVDGGDRETYTRYALRVLNQEGANQAARISVDFDPSYQRLTFHDVSVYRGGVRRNALRPEAVSVLRREVELEWQLYDGRKTATVILDDLREGDVLEYSYSIRGANPVFEGRFADSFRTRFSTPIHRFRYRLLFPKDRRIHIRRHGEAPVERIAVHGEHREYVWKDVNIAALLGDGDVPGWYQTHPWVQLSEWRTWEDVVAWARPMYEPQPGAARRLAADISAAFEDPGERMIAALRFVQDEVRYFGFEMGRGSHEPRPADVILRQRFGDCKDKARLLVSLLTAMGIESNPAFVHSTRGKALFGYDPSPLAFDHVIVAAFVGGKRYWLDPTLSRQRGTLDLLYQPDFGPALLIAEGQKGLVQMEPPRREGPVREIEETLDLTAGLDVPAKYGVRTIYYAASADAMRRTLASQSRQELEKSYLNYYADTYRGIAQVDSMSVYDDEELNRLIVDERYSIHDLWTRSDSEQKITAEFYPSETRGQFNRPRTSVRTAPLAVNHPEHQLHTLTLMLPEAWNVTPERQEIADHAFHFTADVAYAREVITIRYELKTLADHVPPEQLQDHLRNVDRALGELGYALTRYDENEETAASVNWLLVMVGLMSALIAVHLARKTYLYEPAAEPLAPEERDPRYSGLGGWLVLVGIGVVANPFQYLVTGIRVLDAAGPANWHVLTNPASAAYHPGWAPMLTFEVVVNSMMLVFALLMAILFFRRRLSFPRVFPVFLAVAAGFTIADTVLAALHPSVDVTSREYVQAARQAVYAGIWTAYFRGSKRVESTFVRRRDQKSEDEVITDFHARQVV